MFATLKMLRSRAKNKHAKHQLKTSSRLLIPVLRFSTVLCSLTKIQISLHKDYKLASRTHVQSIAFAKFKKPSDHKSNKCSHPLGIVRFCFHILCFANSRDEKNFFICVKKILITNVGEISIVGLTHEWRCAHKMGSAETMKRAQLSKHRN